MTTYHLSTSELRRFFEVFDEDGSGAISPDELCEAFLSLGWDDINPTHCEHMIKEQFGPHVKEIGFEQFRELVDNVQMPTDSVAECEKAFSYFDRSGIGKICVADLKAAGRIATGQEVPDSLIRQLMEAVDTNKDGYIQFSEFHRAVAKVGIKEDPNAVFEKEAGLGVGFGGGFMSGDIGESVDEQKRLMALLLEEDSGDEFENDPNYDPEQGVSLAQTAMHLGGGRSTAHRSGSKSMSKSMVFNGRTVRGAQHKSQHWDVRPHITPSQRAELAATENSERDARVRLMRQEEVAMEDDIIVPHVDALVAEETRQQEVAELQRLKEEAARMAAAEAAAASTVDSKKKKVTSTTTTTTSTANKSGSTLKSTRIAGAPLAATALGAALASSTGPKPSSKAPVATPRGASTASAAAGSGSAPSSKAPSPAPASKPASKTAPLSTATTTAIKRGPAATTTTTTTGREKSPAGNKATKARNSSPSPSAPTADDGSSTTRENSEYPATEDNNENSGAGGGSSAGKQTLVICKHPVTFTNGLVSKAEVRKMMVHFYEDVTDDDFEYLFSEGDKDGDGFLSVMDYKSFLELLGYMDW